LRLLPPSSPYLYPYTVPSLPAVDSIRGFANAVGFAAARRCLQFLVSFHDQSKLRGSNYANEWLMRYVTYHTSAADKVGALLNISATTVRQDQRVRRDQRTLCQ